MKMDHVNIIIGVKIMCEMCENKTKAATLTESVLHLYSCIEIMANGDSTWLDQAAGTHTCLMVLLIPRAKSIPCSLFLLQYCPPLRIVELWLQK